MEQCTWFLHQSILMLSSLSIMNNWFTFTSCYRKPLLFFSETRSIVFSDKPGRGIARHYVSERWGGSRSEGYLAEGRVYKIDEKARIKIKYHSKQDPEKIRVAVKCNLELLFSTVGCYSICQYDLLNNWKGNVVATLDKVGPL